jgi:hypothetical protein
MALKVHKEIRAPKVTRVLKVLLVKEARKVTKAIRAHKEIRDKKV